jgi:Spy/CpxP family protein refolding chaperone
VLLLHLQLEGADRLDLDKATRKKMRSLSLSGRKAIRAVRDEIQELREEMNELLAEDTPDRAAVMAKVDEIGALELKVQKQHLTTMLDIRDLLSEEQRAELRKIHDEMIAESGGGVAQSAPEDDDKETSE